MYTHTIVSDRKTAALEVKSLEHCINAKNASLVFLASGASRPNSTLPARAHTHTHTAELEVKRRQALNKRLHSINADGAH